MGPGDQGGNEADIFVAEVTVSGPSLPCQPVSYSEVDTGIVNLTRLLWPSTASARQLVGYGGDFMLWNKPVTPDDGFIALFPGTMLFNPTGSLVFSSATSGSIQWMEAASTADGEFWVLAAVSGGLSHSAATTGGVFPAEHDGVDAIDSFVVKYSTSGSYLGDSLGLYEVKGAGNQFGIGIDVDPMGNVYVAGRFDGDMALGTRVVQASGGNDAFLLKLSSTGTLLWGLTWGDTNDQAAHHVVVKPNGNVVVAGVFDGEMDFGGTTTLSSPNGQSLFVVEIEP